MEFKPFIVLFYDPRGINGEKEGTKRSSAVMLPTGAE